MVRIGTILGVHFVLGEFGKKHERSKRDGIGGGEGIEEVLEVRRKGQNGRELR